MRALGTRGGFARHGARLRRRLLVLRLRQQHGPGDLRRAAPYAAARRADLDHHRLCFDLPIGPGERGVANLVVEPGARTWGVIYHLSAAACDFLDRTEGVDRGLYRRTAIEVTVDDSACVPAFAYLREARDPRRKPSPRYLGLLLEGARELALPAEDVAWLAAFPLAIDERE